MLLIRTHNCFSWVLSMQMSRIFYPTFFLYIGAMGMLVPRLWDKQCLPTYVNPAFNGHELELCSKLMMYICLFWSETCWSASRRLSWCDGSRCVPSTRGSSRRGPKAAHRRRSSLIPSREWSDGMISGIGLSSMWVNCAMKTLNSKMFSRYAGFL